jgi:hypothetical protein
VLSRHLLLVALCYSTVQTLARRHHIPFDHTTNRVNAASLFFSFGYVKNRKKTNRVNAASLFFSFGYEKKQKKQTESTTASLFFSFGYVKKQKKENEGERIRLSHPGRFKT